MCDDDFNTSASYSQSQILVQYPLRIPTDNISPIAVVSHEGGNVSPLTLPPSSANEKTCAIVYIPFSTSPPQQSVFFPNSS